MGAQKFWEKKGARGSIHLGLIPEPQRCRIQKNRGLTLDAILDVSKSDTVHTFVSDFAKQLNGKKIYALVNNAGCMIERAENAFGYEINFATNTLGIRTINRGWYFRERLKKRSQLSRERFKNITKQLVRGHLWSRENSPGSSRENHRLS